MVNTNELNKALALAMKMPTKEWNNRNTRPTRRGGRKVKSPSRPTGRADGKGKEPPHPTRRAD